MSGSKVCDFCGKSGPLKRCSVCKVAGYCSAQCQKKDWKSGHKEDCKNMHGTKEMFLWDCSEDNVHCAVMSLHRGTITESDLHAFLRKREKKLIDYMIAVHRAGANPEVIATAAPKTAAAFRTPDYEIWAALSHDEPCLSEYVAIPTCNERPIISLQSSLVAIRGGQWLAISFDIDHPKTVHRLRMVRDKTIMHVRLMCADPTGGDKIELFPSGYPTRRALEFSRQQLRSFVDELVAAGIDVKDALLGQGLMPLTAHGPERLDLGDTVVFPDPDHARKTAMMEEVFKREGPMAAAALAYSIDKQRLQSGLQH